MSKRTMMGVVLLLVLLSACGGQEEKEAAGPVQVERNGWVYTVDWEKGTIQCEDEVIRFTMDRRAGGQIRTELTYSDGSTYHWESTRTMGMGGSSDDYNPPAYADGEVLVELLEVEAPAPTGSTGSYVLLALPLIALGLWGLIAPRSIWYISVGWRLKDAEPSETTLRVERISGGVAAVIGAALFFM